VAVLYTSKLVAGAVTGLAEFVALNAKRGISRPELDETISSIAEAAGVAPLELIPTFCDSAAWQTTSVVITRKESFFMVLSVFTLGGLLVIQITTALAIINQ
jgi:hypothetical protein